MKKHIYAFFAGVVFATGLGVSGMSQPSKVRGFLDFFGDWDMTLLFVLGPAVGIYLLGTYFAKRLMPHRFVDCVSPEKMTPRFYVGCVLFGAGWGIVGICPGPSLVILGQVSWSPVLFFGFLLVGIFVADLALAKFGN